MRRRVLSWLAFGGLVLAASDAAALDRAGYDEVAALVKSARAVEADVFAPAAFGRAAQALARAEQDLVGGKKQADLDRHVAEARENLGLALKATDVGKLALKQHLEPREKARQARAPELAAELHRTAEARFAKAAAKVESGDLKAGLKEAQASAPLFDEAELAAIRLDVLGAADQLIARAVIDEAEKYAIGTLERARAARAQADKLLAANRADRPSAVREARRAEFEARHASTMAQSVRALARNDQAWEKVMLLYEAQMERAGQALGIERLPFDLGPQAAADTLLARAQALQTHGTTSGAELAALAGQLRGTLGRLAEPAPAGDAQVLARAVDARLVILLAERDELAAALASGEAKLTELSQAHAAADQELSARRDREERFRKAKERITPAEGEVLYNPASDVVLRLHGLAFESGKSDIRAEQVPLLEKVKEIVRAFPNARLVVEGHTDGVGDGAANTRLAEKRALAVMQYLRESLLIPAERIQALGYGAERPVAANDTPEGRARNRRIDIVIME